MTTKNSSEAQGNIASQVEVWPLDKLVPYARNPRKNDSAVDQMVSSIREFGFKIPCLVRSDGEVVDGHLRLKAARKLNLTEIPVILCDEWTAAQVKAFRLMVNRSVTWADWDEELPHGEEPKIQTFRIRCGKRGAKHFLSPSGVYNRPAQPRSPHFYE